MADTKYLLRRRQAWYSRVPVPRHLHLSYGRKEIVRSLHTRDLSVAQRRRLQHVQEAMEDFDRHQRDPGALSPEEIQGLAWEAYNETLKQAEADGLDEEDCDEVLNVLGDALREGKYKGDDLEEAKAAAEFAAFHGRIAMLRGRPYHPPGLVWASRYQPCHPRTNRTEGEDQEVYRGCPHLLRSCQGFP